MMPILIGQINIARNSNSVLSSIVSLLSIDELVNFLLLNYAHVLSLHIHLLDSRVQQFVQLTNSFQ